MVNRAARRAPAEKKAPVLKLTEGGRRQNNMSIAKRASLFYISTLCGLLGRKDAMYESSPIGLSVLDARSVFGTWNQSFPTYIRLMNLHHAMEARIAGEGEPTLETVTLLGFSRLARIVARAALPEGAAAEILALHRQTLEDVAAMFERDKGFMPYRETRMHQMQDLFDKLR